jgi:hypothetical protein
MISQRKDAIAISTPILSVSTQMAMDKLIVEVIQELRYLLIILALITATELASRARPPLMRIRTRPQ